MPGQDPWDPPAPGRPPLDVHLLVFASLVALLLLSMPALADGGPDWDEVEAETLVDDVGRPVDLAIAPGGDLWFNAFDEGNVTVVDPTTGERRSSSTWTRSGTPPSAGSSA